MRSREAFAQPIEARDDLGWLPRPLIGLFNRRRFWRNFHRDGRRNCGRPAIRIFARAAGSQRIREALAVRLVAIFLLLIDVGVNCILVRCILI